ncbi:MAG: polyphosphate kinase 1 [Deltaproteobacteria bacterium]|nr:polyphosphate kinase 1 [Deltaproteobacteria bacterium]
MAFDDPSLFINRELSMLAFQRRVLEEADDRSLPIFERLKFLGIVSSNLDEYFMVRASGVKQQLVVGVLEKSADGRSPQDQALAIAEMAQQFVVEQYRVFNQLMADIKEKTGAHVIGGLELNTEQQQAAREYFATVVFPALTPLAVDPGHPFPHLRNKSLNVALFLRRKEAKQPRRGKKASTTSTPEVSETSLAVVQMPTVLPRLVKLPSSAGTTYLPLEELIAVQAAELFPGFTVVEAAFFRVTRNWDINIDEEDSEDLVSAVQEELRRRDRGMAVRLELSAGASDEVERTLCRALSIAPYEVYRLPGPLQLQDVTGLAEGESRPELFVDPLVPAMPLPFKDTDNPVFNVIRDKDVLLHHPYESFDPVVRFIEEAADDPNVLAIKQTLYRTSWNSPFVRALSRAAENGKQVAVLVEIKARFDEANNIAWARRLEDSGVHVVYGLLGLKTHAKVALVVRREGNAIRRYIHLGTGNYNPQTARSYTDLSLFTARSEIADDVSALFNMLTGLSDAPKWKRLTVAPLTLQDRVLFLINRETERAKKGEPARIVAKMNSLVDPTVVRTLYEASSAGVEIDLIVRGMCALRPGVPGVSERIRVTSIVDRFLEHSRIFVFGTGATTEVYLSSADWMTRNFAKRIEVMFPIEDPVIKQRVLDEIIGTTLADNQKARRLAADGTWSRADANAGNPIRSQTALLAAAHVAAEPKAQPSGAWRAETGRLSLVPRPPTGS